MRAEQERDEAAEQEPDDHVRVGEREVRLDALEVGVLVGILDEVAEVRGIGGESSAQGPAEPIA